MIKYQCKFEKDVFIDENSENYKNCCDFKNHPKEEKIHRKFYDKHLFRYSLKCKLQEKGEPITVILMNPSYADEYGLDSTLYNVKEFLENQKTFSYFEILNVFPIRSANNDNLISIMKNYQKYQDNNNKYIKETLKKSKNVLIAWGSKYHNYAKWIFEFLKEKNVYTYCQPNKNGSPRHFSPQAYNTAKNKKLNEYKETN